MDRREENSNAEQGAPTPGNMKITFRMLVSKKMAIAIIGRNAEKIHSLTNKYGAEINIPKPRRPERICIIRSKKKQVLEVVKEILTNLKHIQSGPWCIRILFHYDFVNYLVRNNSEGLRQISQELLAKMEIFHQFAPLSTEQVIAISGEVTGSLILLSYLLDKLIEYKQLGSAGFEMPYNTLNYDEFNAPHYGGFKPNATEKQGYYDVFQNLVFPQPRLELSPYVTLEMVLSINLLKDLVQRRGAFIRKIRASTRVFISLSKTVAQINHFSIKIVGMPINARLAMGHFNQWIASHVANNNV